MCHKCGGNCGVWVLIEIIQKNILKIWKISWEPFRSYLLNSTANSAQSEWKWAGLAVLFSVNLETKVLSHNFSQKTNGGSFFLSWHFGNTWNLNFDFKFEVFPGRQDRNTNSFVCFLGEVTARQFCFEICWPLVNSCSQGVYTRKHDLAQKNTNTNFKKNALTIPLSFELP